MRSAFFSIDEQNMLGSFILKNTVMCFNRKLPRFKTQIACLSLIINYNIFMAYFFLAVSICLVSCTPSTFTIGLMAGLSGINSDLGISGRNGALLAIEEINNTRSFDEPQWFLEEWDDKNQESRVKEGMAYFDQQKIGIIIGPYVSAMGEVAIEKALEFDLFLISPSISSTIFDNRNDPLFRLTPSLKDLAPKMGEFVNSQLNSKRIIFVYDLTNREYGESYYENYKNSVPTLSERIIQKFPVDTSQEIDWKNFVNQILSEKPDAIVLVLAGRYAALLTQLLRQNNYQGDFLLSSWATTGDGIAWAGESYDRAYLCTYFANFEADPELLSFKSRYLQRFGCEPSFSSFYSYAAIITLHRVLKGRWSYPGWKTLGQWIRDLPPQPIYGKIFQFNQYGDQGGSARIYQIVRGKLTAVDF
jgi:branched-chain amino acid transport system substrate-binding protein